MTVTLSIRPSSPAIEPLVYVYGEPRGPLCLTPRGQWISDEAKYVESVAWFFDGEALMVKSGSSSTVRVQERPVGPGWNLVPVPGVVEAGTHTFSVRKGHEIAGDTASGHAPPESRAHIAAGNSTLFGHIGDLDPTTRMAIAQVEVGPSLGDCGPDEAGEFDVATILERAGGMRSTSSTKSDAPAHAPSAYQDISGPLAPSKESTELGLPIGAARSHLRDRRPECPPQPAAVVESRHMRTSGGSGSESPDIAGHRVRQAELPQPNDPKMDATVVDLDWAPESGPRPIAPSLIPPGPDEGQTSYSQTSYSWMPRSASRRSVALGIMALLIAVALGIAAFFLI